MDAYSLGRYLQEAREAKELTLDNAVSTLKIRPHILESFENGEFNIVDVSQVQLRGFIRNYARFLGLDDDLVIQYYESSLHKPQPRSKRGEKAKQRNRRRTPQEISAVPKEETQPRQAPYGDQREEKQQLTGRLFNLILVVIVASGAILTILFVLFQIIMQSDDNVLPGNPDILHLPPQPSFTVAPTFTPRPTLQVVQPVQQDFDGRGVAVTIETNQRTWLRVLTDGNEQIARIVRPNEVLDYRALNKIVVTASNAEALIVVYNGQPQGLFGGRGQAVDLTFSTDDVDIVTGPGFEPTSPFDPTSLPTDDQSVATLIAAQTPSNTPGPSPTPTDTPTITFTPSDTPLPTDTPTITPTPSDTLTPSNTPTITPLPSETFTPTPTAVLPPRATSENPTPAK